MLRFDCNGSVGALCFSVLAAALLLLVACRTSASLEASQAAGMGGDQAQVSNRQTILPREAFAARPVGTAAVAGAIHGAVVLATARTPDPARHALIAPMARVASEPARILAVMRSPAVNSSVRPLTTAVRGAAGLNTLLPMLAYGPAKRASVAANSFEEC